MADTGSTNQDVLAMARDGQPEGIVLVADHQHAGRGRRGRVWEAPARSALMATVLLRPPAGVAGLVTMALGVAASEAIEQLTGVRIGLKWPNDLVWPGDASVPDRKVAGILAEADWPATSNISSGWSPPGPGERVAVAAGIGLNVAWAGRAPADLADRAVAIDEIVAPNAAPDRVDLLVALLGCLDPLEGDLRTNGGPERLVATWRERAVTIGQQVRVDLGHDDVVGTAVDVTKEGHLVVETLEGERRVLAVGDVVHLRKH